MAKWVCSGSSKPIEQCNAEIFAYFVTLICIQGTRLVGWLVQAVNPNFPMHLDSPQLTHWYMYTRNPMHRHFNLQSLLKYVQ